MDLYAVDLCHELRQLVQPRLDAPEVVLIQPVAGQRLSGRELHSLRALMNELLTRPTCRGDTPAQIVDLLGRKLDMEWTDRGRDLAGGGAHRTTSPLSTDPAPTLRLTAQLSKRSTPGSIPWAGPVFRNDPEGSE